MAESEGQCNNPFAAGLILVSTCRAAKPSIASIVAVLTVDAMGHIPRQRQPLNCLLKVSWNFVRQGCFGPLCLLDSIQNFISSFPGACSCQGAITTSSSLLCFES
jgi:hypothetical protein